MNMSLVYAFFAEGFEEVEGLTVVNLLKRAGIDVLTVSITDSNTVTSTHEITLKTDVKFSEIDIDKADVLFLPGGVPGTPNLAAHKGLVHALNKFNKENKRIAAICAAPSILGELGILEGKKVTCFPGFEDKLKGAINLKDKVVTDGNITTGKGLGAAMEFGLELIRILDNKEKADEIAKMIQLI